jgi:hypothetical protein
MSWVKPKVIHKIVTQKSAHDNTETKKLTFSNELDIKANYFETFEGKSFLNSMIATVTIVNIDPTN